MLGVLVVQLQVREFSADEVYALKWSPWCWRDARTGGLSRGGRDVGAPTGQTVLLRGTVAQEGVPKARLLHKPSAFVSKLVAE